MWLRRVPVLRGLVRFFGLPMEYLSPLLIEVLDCYNLPIVYVKTAFVTSLKLAKHSICVIVHFMSIKIFPTEGMPIDIDGYLNQPEPGPEQPSAADDSFPSVRLGRAMRRIVEHSISPLITVGRSYEVSGNCTLTAGFPPARSEAVSFDDVEPTVSSVPPPRSAATETRVFQFDTRYDWITRNLDGRRNVADPISDFLEYDMPGQPVDVALGSDNEVN